MKTIKLIPAVALCASAMYASAADLYVNTTGLGGAYTVIQDAVNAAASGDTIHIAEGVYATGGREIEGYTHARVYIDVPPSHIIPPPLWLL